MADANRGLDARVDKLEQIQAQLQDAMLVHATLESKAAQRIKEHAEWIARHDEAIEGHDEAIKRHDTVISQQNLLMLEIEGKLNALIDIVGSSQGGIRPS